MKLDQQPGDLVGLAVVVWAALVGLVWLFLRLLGIVGPGRRNAGRRRS
jgi:hypothetical protein